MLRDSSKHYNFSTILNARKLSKEVDVLKGIVG